MVEDRGWTGGVPSVHRPVLSPGDAIRGTASWLIRYFIAVQRPRNESARVESPPGTAQR